MAILMAKTTKIYAPAPSGVRVSGKMPFLLPPISPPDHKETGGLAGDNYAPAPRTKFKNHIIILIANSISSARIITIKKVKSN
jgi:hypothetical protein